MYQQHIEKLERIHLEEQLAQQDQQLLLGEAYKEEQLRLEQVWKAEALQAETRYLEQIERLEQKNKEDREQLLAQQKEAAAEARKRDEQRRLMDKISRFTNSDNIDAYLFTFEEVMKKAEMAEDKWPMQLEMLLTGKVLEALAQHVPVEAKNDYWALKEALLNAMGFSIVECVNAIFQEKKPDGSWAEVSRKIQFQVERMQKGCITLAEANSRLVINRLLMWATPESASSLLG